MVRFSESWDDNQYNCANTPDIIWILINFVNLKFQGSDVVTIQREMEINILKEKYHDKENYILVCYCHLIDKKSMSNLANCTPFVSDFLTTLLKFGSLLLLCLCSNTPDHHVDCWWMSNIWDKYSLSIISECQIGRKQRTSVQIPYELGIITTAIGRRSTFIFS